MATAPPSLSMASNANVVRRIDTKNPSNPLFLLRKCTSLRELEQIHSFAIKTHLQNDLSVVTKLINFCTQNPTMTSMAYAQKLFDKITEPDVVLYNTMARGCSRSNYPSQAIPLFVLVLSSGLLPDGYTVTSALKACASTKAFQEGKQLHCIAIKLGLDDNVYICPTLISMYTECNDVHAARQVFDKISEPCVVLYNAIITGYTRSSRITN